MWSIIEEFISASPPTRLGPSSVDRLKYSLPVSRFCVVIIAHCGKNVYSIWSVSRWQCQHHHVSIYFPNNLEVELTNQWWAQGQKDNKSWFGENLVLLVQWRVIRAGIYPPVSPVIWQVGILKPCNDWYVSLLFILAQHISLQGKVICGAGLVSTSPALLCTLTMLSCMENKEELMSLPDEVIKGVKGLKSDYYIFNSSGELQQEAAEHSISEGGSSRGSALWPSSTLRRYALLFWLFCAACCSHNLLLVSAIFIVPHTTATFPPSAPSFVFLPAHLFFCCSLPPYFSHCFSLSVKNKLFFIYFFLHIHPHAITSTLTLLNLEFTFLVCLICVHAVIYKVSNAQLPQVTFFPQCGQVIFG